MWIQLEIINMRLLIHINILLLLFLYSFQFAVSQNIYDYEHTEEYADYLFHSKDYKLAVQEFERLIFINPDNIEAKIKLVKSYRYLNQDSIALQRFDDLFTNNDLQGIQQVSKEYINLLINTNQYNKSQQYLSFQKTLSDEEEIIYRLFIDLYSRKWENANNVIVNNNALDNKYFDELIDISNQAIQIKYKKPWLSGGLSAIIPGTGKIYSGYWKDGLVSLLFVGISSWQAYRGFEKNGVQSIYGWIYGGVALGFYTGNIYGSVKAVNKYNYTQDHNINHKVDKVFNDYIDH